MEYRLKIDGDPIEKESWDLFVQTKFSNYEIFWQKFVVPRTNRPDNLYLKQEFLSEEHENEALITQIHYSILLHFYYIYKNINRCEDDFIFDNLITRLSSITDLVEEFLFRYLIYLGKIDITKLVKNFDNSKLEVSIKDATKNLKKGMNYSLPIFDKQSILKKEFNSKNYVTLMQLVTEIRSYRNKVVHSWISFRIDNKVPSRLFLVDSKFKKYSVWTNVYGVLVYKIGPSEDKQRIIDNYIEKDKLILEYMGELITLINLVWKDVVEIK